MYFCPPFPCMETRLAQSPRPPLALVVDDEPLIRIGTTYMVANKGFEVIETKTSDEAFAFLKRHLSLRLLITDIQTPGAMAALAVSDLHTATASYTKLLGRGRAYSSIKPKKTPGVRRFA